MNLRRHVSPNQPSEAGSVISEFSVYNPERNLVVYQANQDLPHRRMPAVTSRWTNRPQPELQALPARIRTRINQNRPAAGLTDVISIHVACMTIVTADAPRGKPQAVWIAVVNSDEQIVFESFVKYPKNVILNDNRLFHGLTFESIRYGKPLRAVVQQLIEYFGTAKTIVCLDAEATFNALGLTRQDQQQIAPRLIDILKFYSPDYNAKFAYRYILFLLFENYDIWKDGRSPVNEARAGMWLYLYDRRRIENDRTQEETIPNLEVARRYQEFRALQSRGLADWPESFSTSAYLPIPRHRGFP